MDFNTIVSVLLVMWQSAVPTVAVHSGPPLSPASGSVPPPAGVGRASGSPWRRPRVKRCSCSSLMDKECVYFCHLDIIWINTPEQTVPYGLGNTRSRRALQDKDPLGPRTRCWCTNGKDNTCWDFCQTGAELRAQSALKKGDGSRANTEEDCLGPGPKCLQGRVAHGRRMNRALKSEAGHF
ncbi:endothelin-1 isoform X2 [Ambystoma mexicanum]|uniref:endothelin-1 isoform X2 n=1 Tax=Ambystoma mexicanum TaxID=8296 RepID=UPI0037E93C22